MRGSLGRFRHQMVRPTEREVQQRMNSKWDVCVEQISNLSGSAEFSQYGHGRNDWARSIGKSCKVCLAEFRMSDSKTGMKEKQRESEENECWNLIGDGTGLAGWAKRLRRRADRVDGRVAAKLCRGCAIAATAISTGQSAEPNQRRRSTRAKVSFPVHVRGGVGTLEGFEEFTQSMDMSHDGLLLTTSRGGYWVGQIVQVTCPYWKMPTAINRARRAKVIRTMLLPNHNSAVAMEFETATGIEGNGIWAATPYARQVRVLGVESDAFCAETTRVRLELDGYQVVYVSNAEQALGILRSETPDVLIAEAEGGEISGNDLCAIVKMSDRLQHVHVILLTKSGLPSDYAAGYRLGATICMAKPYRPEQLQKAVHLVAAPPSQRGV
jgi:CheY-like chemotaxis protein